MKKLKTNVGDVYGKLTVRIREENGKGGHPKYGLECECGGTISKFGGNLRQTPKRQDCGCSSSAGQSHRNHGMSYDPLFPTFCNMHNRCMYHPKYVSIFVCEEWAYGKKGFLKWKKHMGPRPHGYSIERKRNDGDYEPNNCSWQSRKTQQGNRSACRYFKSLSTGVKMVRSHWADKLGIKRSTFGKQLKSGKHPDLIEVSYQEHLALT